MEVSIGVFFILIILLYLTFGNKKDSKNKTAIEEKVLPDNADEDVEDKEMDDVIII